MKGSCNCKAITFEVKGAPQDGSFCHCGQCRKQSGGVWASSYVNHDALTIHGEPRWFASSPQAKRGFCPTCGSFLFWKLETDDTTSFSLGAIDGSTGVTITKHIFVADKGDYYEIADDIRQEERF